MPFGPIYVPSIGLTLLKSVCLDEGHRCTIRYSNLAFAQLIGPRIYQAIAEGYPHNIALAGEWLFSGALANGWSNREQYFGWLLDHHTLRSATDPTAHKSLDVKRFMDEVASLISHVKPFLDREVEMLAEQKPDIVGLTSVFQQNAASLAIARCLRERLPETTIVIGGANCEGPMGRQILESFPWIDAVVDGEGEAALASLLQQVSANHPIASRGNLMTRLPAGEQVPLDQEHNAVSRERLAAPKSPIDYSEFFEQRVSTLADTAIVPIHLPFETARGCWWGAKHHCTFCGLNGASMAFRSRDPGEAVDELEYLVSRHGRHPIDAVDNIMDNQYLKTFVPELARRQLGLSVFYEVKANLNWSELVLLKSAGVDRIQPGIESFSSEVLRLMRKGVSGSQNIMLLKWCKELGVSVSWNYLWGFPGEPTKEFSRIAALCRKLTHLPPPHGAGPIRLDRFSPNFENASRLGFTRIRAFPSYHFVYDGLAPDTVERLSYFFTFDYLDHPDPASYVQPLVEALSDWIAIHSGCELVFTSLDGEALVVDTRPCATKPVLLLDDSCSAVLFGVNEAVTRNMLLDSFVRAGRDRVRLEAAIDLLLAHGLLVELDGKLLPIALSLASYQPKTAGLTAIAKALREHGVRDDEGDFHIARSELLVST